MFFRMSMVTKITMKSVLLCMACLLGAVPMNAQPGVRHHTENKRAIKFFNQAMERSREAMASSSGEKTEAEFETVALLEKALALDPGFAEADRALASLDFAKGRWQSAKDRYARILGPWGSNWIRDHFAWAEACRQLLLPEEMETVMMAMTSIPGVLQGPDTSRIQRILDDAAFMKHALANPGGTTPEPLPWPVSTEEDEYFPSVWMGGEGLIFTRRVQSGRGKLGQEDLFKARLTEEGWGQVEPLRGLNTPDNEGAASASGDGERVCFTVCRDRLPMGQDVHRGSCDLYESVWDGARWSAPLHMGELNSPGWESQPSMSPDGQTVFFCRGTGRPGRRQHDIWSAQRQPGDGTWALPTRLPKSINTKGQEMRPFFHPDGRHLYFASDGRPGMGGLDLFVSTRDEQGQWSEPVNLGWPINTPGDESGLVVGGDGRTAFFSREIDGQLDLHTAPLPEEVASEPTAVLQGRILTLSGASTTGGRVRLLDLQTGEELMRSEANAKGRYHVAVPTRRQFVLLAEGDHCLFHSEAVEPGDIQGTVHRDFMLAPLTEGAEVVLRNVFFDSGSSELEDASLIELKRVAQWMEHHPGVLLEIGGHTDDVGSAEDNLALSKRRAEAVRQALLSLGANEGQLTAVGHGSRRPAQVGTSEEARQNNRRTSLTVSSLN